MSDGFVMNQINTFFISKDLIGQQKIKGLYNIVIIMDN